MGLGKNKLIMEIKKRQWRFLVAIVLIVMLTFSVEFAGNMLEAWPHTPGIVNENPYNPSDYAFSLVIAFVLGVLAIFDICFDVFEY
jgi:hypothetical protein